MGKVLEFRAPAQKAPMRHIVVDRTLPLYDALARAGDDLKNPSECREATEAQVNSFINENGSRLQAKIDLDAMRFHTGFYKYDDIIGAEQKRMIGVLSIAIYLTENMPKLWSGVKAMDDSGAAALFDEALERVNAFLAGDYFERKLIDIAHGYENVRPVLSACLNRCGMESEDLSPPEIVQIYVHRLVERTTEAFNRLEQSFK